MAVGVYKITSPSNKVYIGQSVHIERRFNEYKKQFKNCKQSRLVKSFFKYGIDNHIFEIIAECSIEDLNNLERHYQDLYNAIDTNGLNCRLTTSEDKSGIISKETRKKMSDKKRGKPFHGKPYDKKGEEHWAYGTSRTEETRQKMSYAKKNKISNSSQIVINIENGFYYQSIKLAFESQSDVKTYGAFRAMLNGQNKNKTLYKHC